LVLVVSRGRKEPVQRRFPQRQIVGGRIFPTLSGFDKAAGRSNTGASLREFAVTEVADNNATIGLALLFGQRGLPQREGPFREIDWSFQLLRLHRPDPALPRTTLSFAGINIKPKSMFPTS